MTHLRSTLLCALLTAATGCVDNDSTLFIVQVQQATVDNECVVSSDPNALSQLRGFLDLNLRDSYGAALLVGNQLVRRGDADRLRTETGRVQLYQADVEVYDYTAALISTFSQPISGFVDASTGNDPGFGVTSVMLVDRAATEAVAAAGGQSEVVAQVRVLGETLGGLEVETGFWSYPIVVCTGCTTIVEPMTCEDDFIPTCAVGQDTAKVDARDVYADHPCNVAAP